MDGAVKREIRVHAPHGPRIPEVRLLNVYPCSRQRRRAEDGESKGLLTVDPLASRAAQNLREPDPPVPCRVFTNEVWPPEVPINLIDGWPLALLNRKPHLDEIIRVRVTSEILGIHPAVGHKPVSIPQAPKLVSHPRRRRVAWVMAWEEANPRNDLRAHKKRGILTQPSKDGGMPQVGGRP